MWATSACACTCTLLLCARAAADELERSAARDHPQYEDHDYYGAASPSGLPAPSSAPRVRRFEERSAFRKLGVDEIEQVKSALNKMLAGRKVDELLPTAALSALPGATRTGEPDVTGPGEPGTMGAGGPGATGTMTQGVTDINDLRAMATTEPGGTDVAVTGVWGKAEPATVAYDLTELSDYIARSLYTSTAPTHSRIAPATAGAAALRNEGEDSVLPEGYFPEACRPDTDIIVHSGGGCMPNPCNASAGKIAKAACFPNKCPAMQIIINETCEDNPCDGNQLPNKNAVCEENACGDGMVQNETNKDECISNGCPAGPLKIMLAELDDEGNPKNPECTINPCAFNEVPDYTGKCIRDPCPKGTNLLLDTCKCKKNLVTVQSKCIDNPCPLNQMVNMSECSPNHWCPTWPSNNTIVIDGRCRRYECPYKLLGNCIRNPCGRFAVLTVKCMLAYQLPLLDLKVLLAIISNLTYDYETKLVGYINETLKYYSIPTCPPLTTTTSLDFSTPPAFDYSWNETGTLMGKCFVCGLEFEGIPRNAHCADAFAGDFLPLVKVDPTARGQIAGYRKYCRYMENMRFRPYYHVNNTDKRSIWGRWTGGCAVRWTDLTGIYTQRTCRIRKRPILGRHFASKRMAKLELALQAVDNGCIISPMATLLPVSRGISLYARFHACVCTGDWCNGAPGRCARAARALAPVLLALAAPKSAC